MIVALLRWIRLFVFFYLGVVALAALFQRRLIYYPSRGGESTVLAHAAAAGLQPWHDADGTLIGFVRHAQWRSTGDDTEKPAPVLVFHGNAGYAAHRSYFADLFPDRDVYILEYPGFGARTGRPGESSIRAAADDALDTLGPQPVLLVGESIGSGPASWLAGTRPESVAGVVLITPFTSLVDVARSQFPFLPVRLLLRDRWNNARHLGGFPGPVSFLIAEEDRVVPARFGRMLYESYDGTGRLWSVPGADHNTIIRALSPETWRSILRFQATPQD